MRMDVFQNERDDFFLWRICLPPAADSTITLSSSPHTCVPSGLPLLIWRSDSSFGVLPQGHDSVSYCSVLLCLVSHTKDSYRAIITKLGAVNPQEQTTHTATLHAASSNTLNSNSYSR